jgi:HlyD family secretion protein
MEQSRSKLMTSNIGSWFFAVAVVVCGIAYVFRHSLFPADSSAETLVLAPTVAPMTVSVVTAEPRQIVRKFSAAGTLVAREEVLVIAQVTGVPILEVTVDVGDHVSEGQPLAVLDGQRIEHLLAQKAADLARSEAALAQAAALSTEAETALDEARVAVQRAVDLRGKGAISEQTLEQKQTARDVAEARVEAQAQAWSGAHADLLRIMAEIDELNWQREQLTVRASVGGVISEQSAKVGQTTGADGSPLFRIIKDGEIEMEALVLETALPAIRAGQAVTVAVPGEDRTIEGKVRLVSPAVDPATRLGKVWISLTGAALRTGSFASATFAGEARDAITLPHAAVLVSDAGARVQVVENGVIASRPVMVGLNTADGIEITAGLKPGEIVVASAGVFLREGSAVTVVTVEPPKTEGNF